MTEENKFEELGSEAFETFTKGTNPSSSPPSASDYHLTDDLIEKGYDFDNSGFYKPYTFKHENKSDHREIYLKVERIPNQKSNPMVYSWTSKEDGKYRILNYFRRDKLLVEEEIDDKGKSSINKKLAHTGRIARLDSAEGVYKGFFEELVLDVVNSPCLEIFKELDYEFQTIEDDETEDEDIENSEIFEAIKNRRCPPLDDEMEAHAVEVETDIKQMGLIPYLDTIIDKFHIGSHKNIYRKHIGAFNVIRGKGSYLFGTTAKSGEGKSLEDEIAFLKLIPNDYIFKKNQMTLSSFSRYAEASEFYFERMIVYFGDLGGRKSFDKVEDVFDIIKTLITEKFFSRDISEGTSKGGFETITLELTADTIGAVFQTVKVDFLGDDFEQYESRSILSTPFETNSEQILDLIFALNMEDSKENKAQKEAEFEISKYHCYLKHLIRKDIKIINPYRSFFKKLVRHSEIDTRDMQQLLELFDGYCLLTYFNCREINGKLVATQKQLNEFVNHICLDNTLAPIESDFIKMLLGKKSDGTTTKYALTVIEFDEDSDLNPLQVYHNAVLEAIGELRDREQSDFQSLTIDGLDYPKQKKAVAKLLEMFRLRGDGHNHEEHTFFRVSDVKRAYSNKKAYKNIDDVGILLNKLYDKGFIDKLEFYDSKGQNIYYLTSKTEEVIEQLKLDKDDIVEAENFLKYQGVYEADEGDN